MPESVSKFLEEDRNPIELANPTIDQIRMIFDKDKQRELDFYLGRYGEELRLEGRPENLEAQIVYGNAYNRYFNNKNRHPTIDKEGKFHGEWVDQTADFEHYKAVLDLATEEMSGSLQDRADMIWKFIYARHEQIAGFSDEQKAVIIESLEKLYTQVEIDDSEAILSADLGEAVHAHLNEGETADDAVVVENLILTTRASWNCHNLKRLVFSEHSIDEPRGGIAKDKSR